MVLLQQMMVLFLIMMVGFLCRRIGLINAEGSRILSAIVVNVANPACILSSVINTESTVPGSDLALTFGLAIGTYAVLLLLAEIVPGVLRIPKEKRGVYKVMVVFSNIGFMGFPLLSAMYGNEAVLYAAIFTLPYNLLIYTYGISMLEGNKEEKTEKKFPLKKILNIGVVACIIAIILYFVRPTVPIFLEDAIDRLGSLTAPLSMLVIGDAMANMRLKELFADKKLMLFTAIKLLLLPIIGMAFINQLGLSPMLTGVCLVMLATPVGSMTAMLAAGSGENAAIASKGVAVTTLFSVVTMPIVSMISGV